MVLEREIQLVLSTRGAFPFILSSCHRGSFMLFEVRQVYCRSRIDMLAWLEILVEMNSRFEL